MVNETFRAKRGIVRLVRSLERDAVTIRDINVALLTITMLRWIDEVGEEKLRHVLQCEINLIDEGAYRSGYVPPEAMMLDDEEAQRRRSELTVIEGGGGSKV